MKAVEVGVACDTFSVILLTIEALVAKNITLGQLRNLPQVCNQNHRLFSPNPRWDYCMR
jgi:hypothetical protein